MFKDARFLLAIAIICFVLGVIGLTSSVYAVPLSWLISSLKTGVSAIFDSIQSHPDGWFRWSVIMFLVMIFNRLGKLIYLLSQVAFGTNWRYRNYVRRNTRYA